MRIGVPREIKIREYRVGLVPANVRELVARGAARDVRDPLYDGTPLGHARHFAERWPRPHGPEIIALLESSL